MPTVQYIHKGETYTRQMLTPKRITSTQAWFKEARKALKEIPNAFPNGLMSEAGWTIAYEETDPRWLKFDLENRNGEKAYIVILRR